MDTLVVFQKKHKLLVTDELIVSLRRFLYSQKESHDLYVRNYGDDKNHRFVALGNGDVEKSISLYACFTKIKIGQSIAKNIKEHFRCFDVDKCGQINLDITNSTEKSQLIKAIDILVTLRTKRI